MSRISHESVALYAIGALDEADARAFEAHLICCAPCQRELQALAPAIEALALAADPALPPASLRQRVLDAAARKR